MKIIATTVLLLSSFLPAQDRHTHTNGNGHDHNGQHGHNGNGNGHHPNPPTPPSNPPRNEGDCPPAAPVPEPATMLLVGTGLAGAALLRRRRAAKEAAAKELA